MVAGYHPAAENYIRRPPRWETEGRDHPKRWWETEGRDHPKRWGLSPLPSSGTEEGGSRPSGVGGPPPGRPAVAIAQRCRGEGAPPTPNESPLGGQQLFRPVPRQKLRMRRAISATSAGSRARARRTGSANPPATRPRRNSVMVGVAPAGREVISAGPASCQTPSVRRCQKGLCRVFSEPEGPNSSSSFPS